MANMSTRTLILLSVAVVCLLISGAAAASKKKDTNKLQIGVTHRPDSCPQKTKPGDTLKIHYTGTLLDGTKFDSSLDRGDPFSFRLGHGQVIKGWDQGLIGMCVGEKRKLTIPGHLAYGKRGSPPKIPADATLVFETELIAIEGNSGPAYAARQEDL